VLVEAEAVLDGLAFGDGERAVGADLLAEDDAATVGRAGDDGDVSLDLEDVEGACVDARVAAEARRRVDAREKGADRGGDGERVYGGGLPGAAEATGGAERGEGEDTRRERARERCPGPRATGRGQPGDSIDDLRCGAPRGEARGTVLARARDLRREGVAGRGGELVLVEAGRCTPTRDRLGWSDHGTGRMPSA
jgi:hypothetical protein